MIRIKVDGETLFKGELKDWEKRPPEAFKDMIKPGYKPLPWVKPLMVTLSDAVVMGGDMHISVTTHANGFDMKVRT